nr:SDR family oxidoreductase [Angustibacter aerolatus]
MAESLQAQGAGVVVTGGGSGIGAHLARRFAAEGARVVVNDVDADSARAVADEVGALAVPGDAASEAGVRALVEAARDHLGEIDLFCANAGVAPQGGVTGRSAATPAAWSQALEVNVLAHVRAAEALLPRWLERGRGHLLVTASAAGLLTMLGSAPYAVSKHAAVAFAEWLRLELLAQGDRRAGPVPAGRADADADLRRCPRRGAARPRRGRRRGGRRRGAARIGNGRVPRAAAPRGGRLRAGQGGRRRRVARRHEPLAAAALRTPLTAADPASCHFRGTSGPPRPQEVATRQQGSGWVGADDVGSVDGEGRDTRWPALRDRAHARRARRSVGVPGAAGGDAGRDPVRRACATGCRSRPTC